MAKIGKIAVAFAGVVSVDSTLEPVPQMLCKLVENPELEKKLVDAVCSKQDKVPATECEAGLERVWDVLAKRECSKSEIPSIPPMVCELAENQELEKKAIDALCSRQHKVPAAECEGLLTKMWDTLAQKECSKIELNVGPIPEMLCKIVENPEVEKKLVDAACSKQDKVPATECEAGLEKLWDVLAKKECSKSEIPSIPPMVCELAENHEVEKIAIDALCSRQHKVPAAECEGLLTKMWDTLAQKECSKIELNVGPTRERLCKIVENPEVEKKLVDAACSKQDKVPATECEAGLEKLWDVLAKKECSKSEIPSIPPMVCKLAEDGNFESKAVGAVCTEQKKVPTAECDAALTKMWDALAKKVCGEIFDSTAVMV